MRRTPGMRSMTWCCAVAPVLLLGSGTAVAEAAAAEPQIYDIRYLFQVLGSLLLVFGCLFGLLFILRKMQGIRGGDIVPIRVQGSLRVGSREKILLLNTGGRHLLVGVAAGNIRTLHVFDSTIERADEPDSFVSILDRTSARGDSP